MATFNPEVKPTNDPNYTSVTRPISVPDDIRPQGAETNRIMPKGQEVGDRSAEFEGKAKGYAAQGEGAAAKGFGDLFAGVAGIGDFLGKAGVSMVRKDIENKVYEVADAERERYTQILQGIRDGKGVQNILAGGGSDAEGLPTAIQDLPDQLSVLSAAKEGGKLRSTDYRARLLSLAKDLRAQYPGFKNEIDEEFKKVTGQNPANSVITGLIADINAQGHSSQSEAKSLATYIMNHQGDFDDPAEAIQKVQTGEWGRYDVIRQTAPREKMRANIADRQAVFNDSKLSDEDRKIQGGKLLDTVATAAVDDFVIKFTNQMGLKTDEDAASMTLRAKTGGLKASDWQELGQVYADGVEQVRQSLWSDARKHGMVQKMGVEEVEKHIEAAMKRVIPIKDRIFATDVGGIHNARKAIEAMKDDDVKAAMEDPIIGAPARVAQIARALGGDQWAATEGLRQAADGLKGKWGAYGKSMQDAIAAQADMKTSGIPLTLNRVFDSYGERMKNAPDKDKAAVVASTIHQILTIADPTTSEKVKLNYALAAFSDSNRGFIDRLNKDSYDTRGRPTRGQNAVYQDMTSEAMTKSMYELDKTHHGIFQKYVNWTTETLDSLTSRPARYLDQIRNPAIQVGWDSDNHRFKFNYSISDQERSRLHLTRKEEDAEALHVEQIVNLLNNNLAGYRHIAKITGADVDAYVLGSLAKAVGPEALSRVDGIPANIIRDIGLSRLKAKPESK